MLTGRQLAAYCEAAYARKWVYWYGTYGNPCTQSLYTAKKKQYPKHYTSDRASGYQKDIAEGRTCADCVGLIKAFFWSGGDIDAKPKYASNHCPDVSANGMISLCKQTGPIATLPDIPGLVVWKDGHIGVYVGNGCTVEMKGFSYDCKRNRVKDGPWVKWGRLPESMISYDDAPAAPQPDTLPVGADALIGPQSPSTDTPPVGADALIGPPSSSIATRVLKKGCKGSDVKAMQQALLSLGYTLPKYGADGDFGSETQKAVKAFQQDHGLAVDGVMQADDFKALLATMENEGTGITGSMKAGETTGTSSGAGAPPSPEGKAGEVYDADGQLLYHPSESPKPSPAGEGAERSEAEEVPVTDVVPPDDKEEEAPAPAPREVEITGGSVNVRSAPGTEGTKILAVVHKGDRLPYQGMAKTIDGRDWYLVEHGNRNAWVSSKYAKLIDGGGDTLSPVGADALIGPPSPSPALSSVGADALIGPPSPDPLTTAEGGDANGTAGADLRGDAGDPAAAEPVGDAGQDAPTRSGGLPGRHPARGSKICDISKWQPKVDYDAFIADTALIILRAGYRKSDGKVYIDECFRQHADALTERGVRFGVFFYSWADTGEKARTEALRFVEYAEPYDPLFWALDLERAEITPAAIAAFAEELRTLLGGGEKIGAYVAHEKYLKPYRFDTLRGLFDFVWIPKYSAVRPAFPCDLWQYTSDGAVGGIDARVDLSRITGDGHDLEWFTGGDDL